MSGPVNYDGISITKQFLFGTADVPDDFNDRISPADTERRACAAAALNHSAAKPI